MKKVLLLTGVLVLAFSMTAHAKDLWEAAASPKYGEKAPAMLGRGLLNAASCFVDMFAASVKGARETEPQVMGAIGGFAKGALCTVLRATSGILDVATFWIPGWNGIPVCRTYEDCISCGVEQPAAVTEVPVYQAPVAAPVAPVVRESAPQVIETRTAPREDDRMRYVKK